MQSPIRQSGARGIPYSVSGEATSDQSWTIRGASSP